MAIREINVLSRIIDLEIIKTHHSIKRVPNLKLKVENQMVILSLHADVPNQPNSSYVDEIKNIFNIEVSRKIINNLLYENILNTNIILL